MKIHIISTINGKLDEGMRNVATHIVRELRQEHAVHCSNLRDIACVIRNSCCCDCTILFARCNSRLYWLARLIGRLTNNLWIVCVQKPKKEFLNLVQNHPLRANYLAMVEEDLEQLPLRKNFRKEIFFPGIDTDKFCPVSLEKQKQLKKDHGFDPEQPLVVHVGHCSEGRGLQDFSCIAGVQKMVAASGMFSHEETIRALQQDGVRVHQGYLPHIEQIYQMADVYLFPTRSEEHVISLPLSVMEALACGVPVVGYREMKCWAQIPGEEGAVLLVADSGELSGAVMQLSGRKGERCLLTQVQTWNQTAQNIVSKIRSV